MRCLLAVALAVASGGCFSTVPRQDYLARNVGVRAAFDLQCPQGQLAFANLSPPSERAFPDGGEIVNVPDLATQLGVTGCGKRATYVLGVTGWVMNNIEAPGKPMTVQQGVGPAVQPPPYVPPPPPAPPPVAAPK